MLRKLVINDWVHVSSGIVLEDRGRMVNWHVLVGRKVQMQKNGMTITSKEEFLYKRFHGSLCDCPVETVKYIWVNSWKNIKSQIWL